MVCVPAQTIAEHVALSNTRRAPDSGCRHILAILPGPGVMTLPALVLFTNRAAAGIRATWRKVSPEGIEKIRVALRAGGGTGR